LPYKNQYIYGIVLEGWFTHNEKVKEAQFRENMKVHKIKKELSRVSFYSGKWIRTTDH
jgi:hypothetical protein